MTTDKNTILSFGKFSGFTPQELAYTEEGRSYLEWGVENLRNPQWRAAFKEALKTEGFNEDAVRKMATKIWTEAPWQDEDEFGSFISRYIEEARKDADVKTKEKQIFAKYAGIFGKPESWVRETYSKYGEEVTRSMFSSQERFEQYLALCKEIEDLWDLY